MLDFGLERRVCVHMNYGRLYSYTGLCFADHYFRQIFQKEPKMYSNWEKCACPNIRGHFVSDRTNFKMTMWLDDDGILLFVLRNRSFALQ